MKRLCVCLCCVLLALTACGRPASVDTTEAFSAVSEQTTVQTQTQGEPTETESALPPGDVQTEPVTTEAQTEAAAEPTATTAAATTAPTASTTTQKAHSTQTTRETHTLFTTPQRTTGTTTATTKATTTRRPPATTTTKAPVTTTTTRPAATTGAANLTVQPVRNTCTVTIDCRELLEHPEKLKTPEKSAFVPKSGYIVRNVTMEFREGESVYEVLRRVCETHTCTDNCPFCQKDGCIQMESTYTPQFDSYYVEGIHQLYEKDCGGTSGWTYWVNDRFPNYGSSDYIVKPGDRIEWIYSIELDANESF